MDIRQIILLATVGMFAAMIAGDADAQRFKAKKGKFRPPPLPPGISLTETNKIADGVYSFRFRGHRTIFIVTDEGVIMTDPINRRAAPMLMNAVRNVTDKPIKYMVYSHEHRDHVSGGQIFKDAGATVIAQENCVGPINNTPGIVPPDKTFKDRLDITLGGRTVELHYTGKNHGQCLTVMRLPKERIMFTVDIVTPKSILFRNIRGDFFAHLAALKKLQGMEFDRIAPGHGFKTPIAPKSAIAGMIGYMEDLSMQVKAAMAKTKDVGKVKTMVDLSKYKDWRNAGRFLMQNVEGMFRIHSTGK